MENHEKRSKELCFSIAICDDEEPEMKKIETMTRAICKEEKIQQEISCFQSAGELLEKVQDGKEYQLLLIDVMMPGKDGIELARELRKRKMENAIVLLSYNREMALQGYEVDAARYLAKPLEEEKLKEAISFCYGKSRNTRGILIPGENGMRKIMPQDICYIEIAGRKCRICQENETWDTNVSIKELEKLLLEHGFVRCHQSFLVNCSYVKNFRTSYMELADGSLIPVSKHRIKEVRQQFFEYMRK